MAPPLSRIDPRARIAPVEHAGNGPAIAVSLALAAAAIGAACHPFGLRPTVADRLAGVERFLGGSPAADARYLRYTVEAHDGRWTQEVCAGRGVYAERRVRLTAKSEGKATRRAAVEHRYAFGEDERGAWLAVGDRPPVAVDGEWAGLVRTQEALLGVRFTRPGARDEAEDMGRAGVGGWELGFRPDGGRTLTFRVAATGEPRGFDFVDDFGRLTSCGALRWERPSAGSVLAGASCSAVDRRTDPGRRRTHARLVLQESRALDVLPDWARPGPRRPRAALRAPVELPITDERRIHLPVRFGDGPPRELLLDSGAFYTVVSAEAAEAMGVVPTGEPSLYVRPPWLASSALWVGVIDRMRIGDAELHGERVLVTDNPRMLGQDAGLLGANFFSRFVVDVDSPAHRVRLWERSSFPRAEARRAKRGGRNSWEGGGQGGGSPPDQGDATLLRLSGSARTVSGEVHGVAKGELTLDTGMPDDLLVHAWQMKVKHPRARGSDAYLADAPDSVTGSPDYVSEVDGFSLGPFAFPAMPAYGRDRHREFVGGGVALVGMGLMRYFRLAFDFRGQLLHVWPGDAYVTLRRAGMDIEDGPRGPTIDRVVQGQPAARAGLAAGDTVLRVAGRRVSSVDEARRAVAHHARGELRLLVMRNERHRLHTLQLHTGLEE